MTQYVLPSLRYDYGALEPHISGRIMELHHDKHHAGYVKGANETVEQLHEARTKGDFTRLAALQRALAFNLSGHVLHKHEFTTAAATIMGSGWAALVWEPVGGCLLTTQIYDHQSNLAQAGVPLMVLDAWEHAYYLQYENRKTDFFQAAWHVWNWRDVGRRFAAAHKVELALESVAR